MKNTTYEKLWNAVKARLGGKPISIRYIYIKKEKKTDLMLIIF